MSSGLGHHDTELKAEWERGEHGRFYPYGKTYGQVFREQE
jgi:hypothetical protein